MVRNAVGAPVEGTDFFDRAAEISDLWGRLETDNILLLAPRRVGKTSLMLRLRDTAPANGFRAMYLSVAGVPSEAEFSRKLLREAERHGAQSGITTAVKRIAASLGRIRGVEVAGMGIELADGTTAHWTDIGEAITEALQALGGKWLILVDEVPIFVLSILRADNSGARARAFLNWFRDLRQNVETNRSIRWLLAGSIGLDTVTRRMNLGDTINDLFIHSEFGAFDRRTAENLLADLGATHQLPLSAEVVNAIIERTTWLIPYHLQLWFSELRTRCPKRTPTLADVDAA